MLLSQDRIVHSHFLLQSEVSIMDHYTILGLQANASQEEIRLAYHRKAKHYHPDKNQGDTDFVMKFHAIKGAYECLSHPERRAAYDSQRNTILLDDPVQTAREIWETYIAGVLLC